MQKCALPIKLATSCSFLLCRFQLAICSRGYLPSHWCQVAAEMLVLGFWPQSPAGCGVCGCIITACLQLAVICSLDNGLGGNSSLISIQEVVKAVCPVQLTLTRGCGVGLLG